MLIGPQGEILLSDFGIATIAHSTSSMSMSTFAGTPYYMAPEQIREQPKLASDQYALATVVYAWLTGTPPFRGTASEIFAKQLMVEPASLREQVPELAHDVDQVILTALAKDPLQRFASVRAFATALAEAARSPRIVQQPAKQISVTSPQTQQLPFPTQSFTETVKSGGEEQTRREQTGNVLSGPLLTAEFQENKQREQPISTTGEQAIPLRISKENPPANVKLADITKEPTDQFYPQISQKKRAPKRLLAVLTILVTLVCIGALVLFATRNATQMPTSSQVQAVTTSPASTSQSTVSGL
jgi:serine/threonine protein kinase